MTQPCTASHWDLAVAGQLAGALWQVDFPCIYGVRPLPEAQMALPYVMGMLVQNPAGHLVPEDDLQHVGQGGVPAGVGARGQRSLVYPGRLSMQYWAYWGTPEPREPELAEAEGWVPESGWMIDRSDASGLYVAVEDGQLYRKQFTKSKSPFGRRKPGGFGNCVSSPATRLPCGWPAMPFPIYRFPLNRYWRRWRNETKSAQPSGAAPYSHCVAAPAWAT